MRASKVLWFVALLFAGVALAITASGGATTGLLCSTDTAVEAANATLTNRGYAWSNAANPDPTWQVDMSDISQSLDIQAPDEATARAKAKDYLDSQIAAMDCPAPPEPVTETVTTTATVSRTVTTSTPAVTVEKPTIVTVPGATQIVTTAAPAAVPPATPTSPQSIIVNVSVPGANGLRLQLAHTRCVLKRKHVACSRLRDGEAHKVTVAGTWFGDTLSVTKITG